MVIGGFSESDWWLFADGWLLGKKWGGGQGVLRKMSPSGGFKWEEGVPGG